jgi:hypothetical protein
VALESPPLSPLHNIPNGPFLTTDGQAQYFCALRTSGEIACWGYSNDGTATSIPPGSFEQLKTGVNHACVLNAENALTCWGSNAEGQLDIP